MKYNYIKYLLAILMFSKSVEISAQYISLSDDYVQNPYLIDPSYIAKDRGGLVFISKRDYMSSLKGAPSNIDFGGNFPMMFNSAFGLKVNMNKQSIYKVTNAEASFSYTAEFADDINLHLGLAAGILDYRLNKNDIVTGSFDDKVLNDTYYNKLKFTTGAGLCFSLYNFDLHFALPRMLEYSRFKQTFYTMASYNLIAASENKISILRFQPAIAYFSLPYSPNMLDFSLVTDYRSRLILQATYRTNKAYIIGMGLSFFNFTVAYTHEFNTDNLYYIARNSHEITLRYVLDPEGLRKGWNKTIRSIMKQH
jgi:type IX secretion system PorP/SprF family membrane protein